MNRDLEKEIYEYLNKAISFLGNDKDFVFDINYNNNGDESNLFSEIEIEVWKGSSLEYTYAIIMFINGKEQGTKEDLLKEFLYDFFENICSIENESNDIN